MKSTIAMKSVDTFDELGNHLHDLNYEHGQGTAVIITRDVRQHLAFATDPDGEWFLETGNPGERIAYDENDFATYTPLGLEHIKDGGPYFLLHENTDPATRAEPVLEVHELGEDGDLWLVTATTADTHPVRINSEVAKWVIDTCGVNDGTAIDVIERLAQNTNHTFRDDWAYVPINPENPDDECRLTYGSDAPANLPRFAGTLVNA